MTDRTLHPVHLDQLAERAVAGLLAREPYIPPPTGVAEHEALARLEAVISTAVDGIITIDEQGIIESVNPAAVRIFGYASDDLIGQNVKILMPEPYHGEHDRYVANYLRTGERKIIGIGREVVGRRKDGTTFPMELAVSETRLDRRRIFTGIVRDITARRRAERALRESEERFAAFMRHLPGASWLKDLSGRYVYANAEAERIFDAKLETFRGKTDDEVFPEHTAREFRRNDRRVLDEGGNLLTIEVLRQPDGVDHRSIVSKFVVPDLDGQPAYIGGVAFDITERLAAEDALRASERRFRLMADSAPVLIWMSEPDKGRTWFNRPWLEFTGRTVEQESGEGWRTGIHPDDVRDTLQTHRSACDARKPFEIEFRLRRHDGEYHWLHDVGVPLLSDEGQLAGYVGSCTDVTERKRGEELLRALVDEQTRELLAANERLREHIEQRRRAESLVASENRVLELVATGAPLESVLEALCRSIEELLPNSRSLIRLARSRGGDGYTPGAGRFETRQDPIAGVDLFGSHDSIGPLPPVGAERMAVETVRADRAGARLRQSGIRSYWLEPIVAPTGDTLGVLAVYRGTDGAPAAAELASGAAVARLAALAIERTHSEERARQQLAQLAHVSRLATMGEMASGLAHELNQPLCAIVNYAEACVELVNSGSAGETDLRKALGDVARQAERAGEVIRRLREFVRRREPERETVDLNAVVREVVALTAVEARQHDVRVRLKLDQRLPCVLADPIQIQQVLVNLVRNGFDAMRESQSRKRLLTIQTTRRKGHVEVAVSDTGAGIPEHLRERLFEPFFSTKRDGMGMGLSLSRSIVEAHEGRILLDSNRSGGVTFRFTLPTAERKSHG